MQEIKAQLAYVVGDSYAEISKLPGVITATQFIARVLEGTLPLNLIWMAGQGLNSVEQNLLRFCQSYCPEVRFYDLEEHAISEKTQAVVLSEYSTAQNVFSKVSRMIAIILHAGKKSMTKWHLFR
jgi:hypothetical protein